MVLEGFQCPDDPSSYVVGGRLPIVGVSQDKSVLDEGPDQARRPLMLFKTRTCELCLEGHQGPALVAGPASVPGPKTYFCSGY